MVAAGYTAMTPFVQCYVIPCAKSKNQRTHRIVNYHSRLREPTNILLVVWVHLECVEGEDDRVWKAMIIVRRSMDQIPTVVDSTVVMTIRVEGPSRIRATSRLPSLDGKPRYAAYSDQQEHEELKQHSLGYESCVTPCASKTAG